MTPFPPGPFSVVYADPPWYYRQGGRGAARNHYLTMSTAEIAALPVASIAAPDAVLFLWATGPCLFDAAAVIAGWGFVYKTFGFVWTKTRAGWPAVPKWGGGHYTRSNAEVCLLAVRGAGLPVLRHDVDSVVLEPRGEHSAKPAVIRRRIEALFGDVPRVELFARQRVAGWVTWGNEVDRRLDPRRATRTTGPDVCSGELFVAEGAG